MKQSQLGKSERPFLNERAFIAFQTPLDLRVDFVQRAINEVEGVKFKDYKEFDQALNDIIIENERINFSQIDNIERNISRLGDQRLFSTDLFVSSVLFVEGQILGLRARVRGALLRAKTFIRIPKRRRFDKRDIRRAFASETFNAPEVNSFDDFYIITDQERGAEKFLLTSANKSIFAEEASAELNIPESRIVFSTFVTGRILEEDEPSIF